MAFWRGVSLPIHATLTAALREVVYAVDFTKAVIGKDQQMVQQLQTYSAAERKIQGDLKARRGPPTP